MAKIEYDSTKADYIILKFKCKCGKIIETEKIPVLERYDNEKDINRFSHDKPIICPKCKQKHDILFYDDMYNAIVEIPTLEKDSSIIYVHEIPFEYSGGYDTALLDYITEIVKIEDFLKKSKNLEVYDKSIIYKMAFVNIIAIMDAYLGNLFRYQIRKYDLFKENFLLFKYKTIKSKEKDILEHLNAQSFQNLDLIAIPYYRNTFGIIIPSNEIIQNAVIIRNNLTHNFGKEKDGYESSITELHVQKLIEEVALLVKFVNQSMLDVIFDKIIWPNVKNKEK